MARSSRTSTTRKAPDGGRRPGSEEAPKPRRLTAVPKTLAALGLLAVCVGVAVAAVDLRTKRVSAPMGEGLSATAKRLFEGSATSRAAREGGSASPGSGASKTASSESGGPEEAIHRLLSAEESLQRAYEELEKRRRIAREFPLYAAAYPDFDVRLLHARIYDSPGKDAKVIGYLRRGKIVRAKPAVGAPGCGSGKWHPIQGGGYICTLYGYEVGSKPPEVHHVQLQPDDDRAVPFRYVKPVDTGAPILNRLPNAKEQELIEKARQGKGRYPRGIVFKRMVGYFRLSIHKKVERGDVAYLRTVQGHYVRASDVKDCEDPAMRGVKLIGSRTLPIAFVFEKSRKKYEMRQGKLVETGTLQKHARFTVSRTFEHQGVEYVQAEDGTVVPRDSVRVAERIEPPEKVRKGDKWMHVALGEQTLVAYEWKTPVFVTLVSSGKKGYRPPRGTFYVHKKYLTVTMGGKDPIEGQYRVEDVPWTMYYWRSYAVHGAYWHNDFGVPRSHGCTNISPPDAKWLYYWSDPEVPLGWNARIRARGTWVRYTR